MDLKHIVNRFSQGLLAVDETHRAARTNARTQEEYLPGVAAMTEPILTKHLASWWRTAHPEDFNENLELVCEVSYPNIAKAKKAKCDLVIQEKESSKPVWAVEVKRIQLVGNNGNTNDYGIAKMLSPYLKDRSLRHDLIRLSKPGFDCPSATLVYAFSYSPHSISEAKTRFPELANKTISRIDKVRIKAQDEHGVYSLDPLIDIANLVLREEELVGEFVRQEFSGAWAHPCGGNGIVAAWGTR